MEVIITEGSNFGYIQGQDNSKLHTIGNKFKEWVEQTHLFTTIKLMAGTGVEIHGIPDGLRLKLDRIVRIEKAEDLPIELLQQFYQNSPFYTDNTFTQKQIQNNNESTDNESLW